MQKKKSLKTPLRELFTHLAEEILKAEEEEYYSELKPFETYKKEQIAKVEEEAEEFFKRLQHGTMLLAEKFGVETEGKVQQNN